MTVKISLLQQISYRIEALCRVHRRSLNGGVFHSQFWMGWFMILIGLVVMLPGHIFMPSTGVFDKFNSVPDLISGFIMVCVGGNQLISLTDECLDKRIKSCYISLVCGFFLSVIVIGSAILGYVGLGLVVFPFYTFKQSRIFYMLSKTCMKRRERYAARTT